MRTERARARGVCSLQVGGRVTEYSVLEYSEAVVNRTARAITEASNGPPSEYIRTYTGIRAIFVRRSYENYSTL